MTTEPTVVTREAYANMYGPTTGDVIKLGDTDLHVRYGYARAGEVRLG